MTPKVVVPKFGSQLRPRRQATALTARRREGRPSGQGERARTLGRLAAAHIRRREFGRWQCYAPIPQQPNGTLFLCDPGTAH